MTANVRCMILPFAVLEVGRLHEDPCAVLSRLLAVGVGVFHPDHHGVARFAWTG